MCVEPMDANSESCAKSEKLTPPNISMAGSCTDLGTQVVKASRSHELLDLHLAVHLDNILLRTKTIFFTVAPCRKLSFKTHRDMDHDSTTRSCHHAADDDDPRPHCKPLDTRHKHHTSRTVSTNLNGKQHHCWNRDYTWTGRVCPADERKLCESCARVK